MDVGGIWKAESTKVADRLIWEEKKGEGMRIPPDF